MPIPSKAGAQDATRSHTVASIAGSVAVIVAVAVVAVVSVLVLVAVIVCGSGRSGLVALVVSVLVVLAVVVALVVSVLVVLAVVVAVALVVVVLVAVVVAVLIVIALVLLAVVLWSSSSLVEPLQGFGGGSFDHCRDLGAVPSHKSHMVLQSFEKSRRLKNRREMQTRGEAKFQMDAVWSVLLRLTCYKNG